MSLVDYNFKPDYNKSENDIAQEFYLPAMRNATVYDRVSGYFGSTIYIIAWSALQDFVSNGGKMRIICSPCLSDVDKAAMTEGYSAKNDEIIQKSLMKEMDDLFNQDELDKPARVLACLIALGVIDVKIAVPLSDSEPDLQRLFHDKVGIFTDVYGNSVGFRGSMNETFKGLSEDGNSESIDVFPSWTDERDSIRVKNSIRYFDKLWKRNMENTVVYDFPDAVKNCLIEKSNGYDWKQLTKEIEVSISRSKRWRADKKNTGKSPRKHQLIALENWEKNGRRGIFEHATGSGKTYTAICAIRDALDRHKPVLVLVPSKELLHQWRKEIGENITDIDIQYLLCGDGNNMWKKNNLLRLWTSQSEDINKVTISIMDTACSNQFVNSVSAGEHLLLIADEVHRIGSRARRNILNIDAHERLGLSATPVRYGDVEGTSAIFDYFGGIVEPVFSLEDAIRTNVLTKYYYHPMKIALTEQEQDAWNELTQIINKIIASSGGSNKNISAIIEGSPRLQMKMIERSRIIKQAAGKVPLALSVIKDNYKYGEHWIIYCDNQTQLREVLNLLLDIDYDAYEYHSDMTGDRAQTLKYFDRNGGILVSIRCLDEGVDIPATTHALILASSKNPREFIQRRGRILRKHEGKYFAHLYDAIVVPPKSYDKNDRSASIIETELMRAIQFGSWAENPSCVNDLQIIAMRYGIDYETVKDGGYEYDENESE